MVIAYARKKSIKVYIALNTLIKTAELEKIAEYLVLKSIAGGPDYPGYGVLRLIQSRSLPFHLHASTNGHSQSCRGQTVEKMGFKRIVLARELSIRKYSILPKIRPWK